MKLLPTPSRAGGSETEDKMDVSYAGIVTCCYADSLSITWIIDFGASHHITGSENMHAS